MAAQDAQDFFDTLVSYILQGYTNLRNNLVSFINMSGLQWIRIITIVGAYLLIRPYLTKAAASGAAKKQAEAMNDDDVLQRKQDRELEKMGFVSPNVLRGEGGRKVELPEESDSEEDSAKATGEDAKWGAKARKRQRQLLKKIIEQEERARREAQDVGGFVSDEDKDIEEYLT